MNQRMGMEPWRSDSDSGKPNHVEEDLYQSHFVHKKHFTRTDLGFWNSSYEKCLYELSLRIYFLRRNSEYLLH
jgi:hypothetical protein